MALCTAGVFLSVFAPPVSAQDTVGLVADRITVDGDGNTIRAEGNVVVEYRGDILETSSIIYNRRTGSISFPDSIKLTTSDGSVLTAESADVADTLETGVFRDVTLLLAGQFQILATELERRDPQFATLRRGIATSCELCDDGPPFWQIRAKEVAHDTDARELYFTGAVFEFLGIPVFYAPRLRTPDPSVRRASGVLVPAFRTSDTLGVGIEIPYYLVLGDHADATVTSFVTTGGALVFEGEYRQLFENGALIATGAAAAIDPLDSAPFRSFGALQGFFDLDRDFQLEFDFTSTSDRTFRQEFGFGDEDRLNNEVKISKTTPISYFETAASITQSLRDDEDTSDIPFVFPEIYASRSDDIGFGWNLRSELQSVTIARDTDERTSRLGGRLTLERQFISRRGLSTTLTARAEGSVYDVENSSLVSDGEYDYFVPTLATTFRYPLVKSHGGGGRSLIEPIAQLIWTPDDTQDVPNEDSVQLEFEESNLFELNRFPGFDAVEVGSRANIGIRYLYQSPNDWRLGVSLGQVFRTEDLNQFSDAFVTGLNSRYSDTVLAVTLDFGTALALTNRTLIGRDFEVSKYETQLTFMSERWAVDLDYVFLEDDVIQNSNETQNQLGLAVGYRANQRWTIRSDISQDFERDEPIEQFFGASFRNECVLLDFGLTLDYATGSSDEAEREFNLSIELLGFGAETSAPGRSRGCGK